MESKHFMRFAVGSDESDIYVTVKEFASLCGVSRQTIWKLLKRYRIPSKKFGTMKLIRRVDAVRFYPRMVNTQIRMEMREYGSIV